MAHNGSNGLAPIAPNLLYPLESLKAQTGLKDAALRTGRREHGLKVMYLSGRAFIMGKDFISYVQQASTAEK